MRVKWPLLAAVLGVGLSYAAYPYMTLYRLGSAIKSADAATLESLVDWPAVREGIKEDICDLVSEEPDDRSGKELPAFGASFVRGIASSTIDRTVTPQALLAATTAVPANPVPRGADVHVQWAFFDSPTTFLVSLQPSGKSEPIKLEMALRHGAWHVRRVWLPAELLAPGSKT
ncbi:MAG TPA: hypothetical protein DDZ81_25930 [Acetobacteraceae bacterium]|jgi:hypothetical protein|nr:hypothetical protein [Acetobacteraceae bacterium]